MNPSLIGCAFGDRVFDQPVVRPVIGDSLVMDNTTEKQAPERVPGPAPRQNRGWFRTKDERINREGRPKGSKAPATPRGPAVDHARQTDRIMRFFVPDRTMRCMLLRSKSPC